MKITLLLSALSALSLLQATAAPNAIESELFPPDFLLAQREALGLDETQLHDFQATAREVQPKVEALQAKLEELTKTFRDALHEAKPDVAQTEDKLRALLTRENEMKLLQIHLMLTLRNQLTPGQVEKARQLRQQMPAASGDPRQGLPERLQKKFEQLKAALQERALGGAPPEEIVKQVGEIQHLAQEGQPLEAERRIDLLLAHLRESNTKP